MSSRRGRSRRQPRPLTPWAQRFGYNKESREEFLLESEIHSGLAPLYPRISPRFYSDDPVDTITKPRTNAEFDLLFGTEKWQQYHLKGICSWQVGPLMSGVRFSDTTGFIRAGHQRTRPGPTDNPANLAADETAMKVFHEERIKVDESTWLKFLRKDRWLDFIQREPMLGGASWSVDVPKVWEELRIGLELANRILKAMIAEKHIMLETILYGLIANHDQVFQNPKPTPTARLLLSRPYVRTILDSQDPNAPNYLDFVEDLTPAEWEARLEDLLKDQKWSFIDRYDLAVTTWGLTFHENLSIALDVGPFKSLLSGQITLAERCLLLYNMAVTIIHELYHSLWMHRETETNWPNQYPITNWSATVSPEEPAVDYDGMNEMGFAAEKRIFGGATDIGSADTRDLPFGAFRTDWPQPTSQGEGYIYCVPEHPTFQPGSIISISRVPALHASKLLSAAFWDDPAIPNKTDNYFHANDIFKSNTPKPDEEYLIYNPTLIDMPNVLQPGEQELIDNWNERRRLYVTEREAWKCEELRDAWEKSPWSEITLRNYILKFGRRFELADAVECMIIAQFLVNMVDWQHGMESYINDIPPNTTHYPYRWLFHAIGLLMYAAMPVTDQRLSGQTTFQRVYTFKPSKTCIFKSYTIQSPLRLRNPAIAQACQFFDPLGQPNDGQAISFDQFDYLDLVTRLVDQLGKQNAEISTAWLREIMKTTADLRRQRDDIVLRKPGPGEAKMESVESWNFTIPVYDTQISRYRDGVWHPR
ncbi:hypothetical protein GGS21DRAFT_548883 [Xylaria nigripes]|nr:hypothetical protein GGS21DRAFT_548883 [Xylaria nigripes]